MFRRRRWLRRVRLSFHSDFRPAWSFGSHQEVPGRGGARSGHHWVEWCFLSRRTRQIALESTAGWCGQRKLIHLAGGISLDEVVSLVSIGDGVSHSHEHWFTVPSLLKRASSFVAAME